MTIQNIFFLLPALFFGLGSFAQNSEPVVWSLPDVEEAMQKDPRLIVIQLTTDWCVYCKMQDRQLSKDVAINQILEEKTYYVNLNGESKDTLKFNEKVYGPSLYKNGLHDFTLAVSGKNEQPSFPMWVIFNANHELIYRQSGLVKPKELTEVLKVLLPSEE